MGGRGMTGARGGLTRQQYNRIVAAADEDQYRMINYTDRWADGGYSNESFESVATDLLENASRRSNIARDLIYDHTRGKVYNKENTIEIKGDPYAFADNVRGDGEADRRWIVNTMARPKAYALTEITSQRRFANITDALKYAESIDKKQR